MTGKEYPFCAVFALLSLLLGGCQTAPKADSSPAASPVSPVFRQELTVRGPFIHRATGIEFPELFVPFQRAMVCQYDRTGDDISVGYVFNSDREPAALTVYLYPLAPFFPAQEAGKEAETQALLDVHYTDILSYILTASKDPVILQMGPYTLRQSGKALSGRRAVIKFRGAFDGTEQECISCLYLFCYKNWFIQYRVIYPSPAAELALESTENFIQDFPILPKMVSVGL